MRKFDQPPGTVTCATSESAEEITVATSAFGLADEISDLFRENDLRTCTVCKEQDWVYRDGRVNLCKYGVRHYAHAKCLVERHGCGPAQPVDRRRGVVRGLSWEALREFPTALAEASGGWGELLAEERRERKCEPLDGATR